MPTVFKSPLCPVCLSVEDSPSHLLFHCSFKENVWQGVIIEVLWPITTIQDLQEALLSQCLVLPSQSNQTVQDPHHCPLSAVVRTYAFHI
ncbi:hypothetical protein HMPREF1544_04883 [Mucor circinelloides 1006PhL]|uniref:Reverse transcriptase zinc-binding domain-containing protein n=1 Tax=Mucor circinelloides f. circinelloides (strain 1006PhL) TaxID=1220926 RepID=S2JEK8_MUCC1|nr:hypothetical protein HMPREF1544_04883 [Mucor circinelloides 1006PhL]